MRSIAFGLAAALLVAAFSPAGLLPLLGLRPAKTRPPKGPRQARRRSISFVPLLGPVGAAVFGGVGALIATGLWAKLFPDLRKADRLA